MYNQAVEDYMKEKARLEGKKEGKLEGEQAKALSIAKAMIQESEPIEKIARLTGLSTSDIKKFF